jgi:hypothetical protein
MGDLRLSMEYRYQRTNFYIKIFFALSLVLFFIALPVNGQETQANEPSLSTENKTESIADSEDPTKTAPILMSPLDQHYSELNFFLEDCLKLINPPLLYFSKIEVQPTQTKNYFLVRLTGKLPKQKTVEFSKNFIEFIDSHGQVEKLVFDPQIFQIQKDSDGQSLLSFIAPSSRTIRLSLVFRQKSDQEYDLIIEIDKFGDIKKALFIPVLDSKKKLNFCPKSLIQIGASAAISDYNQRLASINSDVYAAPQILQLDFKWYQVISRKEQRLFTVEGGLQDMPLPESDLFAAQNFSTVHFQTQYLWQFRENRYNALFEKSILSPYFRFGIALENTDIFKFTQANLIDLDRSSSLQFVSGLGLNAYVSKSWMMDFSGDLKIQGYGTGVVKNYLSLEGQWNVYYQPQWRWKNSFLGLNTKLIYSDLTYERDSGLDKNGTVHTFKAQGGAFWGLTF